jgi:Protein of unknown function (DUF2892)
MKANISQLDRIIRIAISIILVVLFITNTLTGIWGYLGLVLAGVFTITALVNFCPIYYALGLSSRK